MVGNPKGYHPKSEWKPGCAPTNPKGAPKRGYSITECIKELFQANPELRKKVGQKIVDMALQGHEPSFKLLWSYMDGLPPQTINQFVSGSIGLTRLLSIVKEAGEEQGEEPKVIDVPGEEPKVIDIPKDS